MFIRSLHTRRKGRARVPAERVGGGEGRGAWGDPARVLDSSFMFQ